MKRFTHAILSGLAVLPLITAVSYAESETGDITNKSAQALNFRATVDTDRYKRVSAQAIYSDGTQAAHIFRDGVKATNKLTVQSLTNLTTGYAQIRINILHNNGIQGAVLTLNNQIITEGIQWTRQDSASESARNLAYALDAYGVFRATQSLAQAIVYASATVSGTEANSWAAASNNSSVTVSAANFSGGGDAASITINGVTLTQGVEWFVGASTVATAADISRAINAHASLTGVVVSSVTGTLNPSAGMVFTTAAVVGANYAVSSSTGTLLWLFSNFNGGKDSEVSVANDSILRATHTFATGQRVYITTTTAGSTMPTGLVGTTYYISVVDTNNFKLATSSMNAVAGTAIDITAVTGGGVMTMTPTPLAAGAGAGLGSFKWQASNDNSNWSDLSVTSVTWSAAGNTVWDFGDYNYRFLSLLFTGPINGGIRLNTYINGKVE